MEKAKEISESKKTVLVIGAGPAGLTAASVLLKKYGFHPVVLEASGEIGGISRTVVHHGNRMDIGGHRFFSKSPEVMDFWTEIMPVQGTPAWDDKLLGTVKTYSENGPDPEKEDAVMLLRRRVSRILYLRRFFDYPLSLKLETFLNMGFVRTMYAGFGYVWSAVFKRKECSLKDFMINRFGTPLYRMFFEKYTEKVWGKNPADIEASWGRQRIRGLSLWKALKNIFSSGTERVETSLINQFFYPKKGPGQFWEKTAEEILNMGGEIILNAEVVQILSSGDHIDGCIAKMADGTLKQFTGDSLFSSMAVKDLVAAFKRDLVPDDVFEIASSLPYRDFMTAGVLVDRLLLENKTHFKTVNNIIPDCWIYIQEPNVRMGRMQIFNNWSPYMIEEPDRKVWIGLEYFCQEGDSLWCMTDDEFRKMTEDELVKLGIIMPGTILDFHLVRVRKAYPAYFGSYDRFPVVRRWLDSFRNLYCIGRNGQHRYNNMDHSMLSGMRAADSAASGGLDKSSVWNINTEDDYHEEKNS